jgi:hypothetical protein
MQVIQSRQDHPGSGIACNFFQLDTIELRTKEAKAADSGLFHAQNTGMPEKSQKVSNSKESTQAKLPSNQ